MTQILSRALVFVLCLSLSDLATLAVALRHPNSAMAEVHPTVLRLTTTGDTLEQDVRMLIRRAKHPDSPGTSGGVPSASEETAIEGRVSTWKREVETALNLPNSPVGATGDGYIPVDGKLQVINVYFNVVTDLASLRIAMSLSRGRSWGRGFDLRISRAVIDELPGFGSVVQDRGGDRFNPLVVDRGADGTADPVSLRVSQSLIQGLEAGMLAGDPSNANFIVVLKYLAVRQLLQNLVDIKYLKSDHQVTMPAIPSQLTRVIESMGQADELMREQEHAVLEPYMRASIVQAFEDVKASIPVLVDATLVGEVARIAAGDSASAGRTIAEDIQGELDDARNTTFIEAIRGELEASSSNLSGVSRDAAAIGLRNVAANAQANILLNELMDLVRRGVIVLDRSQRERIVGRLDERKRDYLSGTVHASFGTWHDRARSLGEDRLFAERRSAFIADLQSSADDIGQELSNTSHANTPKPSILARVFSERLIEMAPRSSVRDWFFEVARGESYDAARDAYTRIMVEMTSDTVVNGRVMDGETVTTEGVVDPVRVRLYVENHDFTPDLTFPDSVSTDLADLLRTRIRDGRTRDIDNWLTIGEWFRFTRLHPLRNPTVSQVLTSSEQRTQYYQHLEDSIYARYPILREIVEDDSETRLYRKILDANPDRVSSPEVEEEVSRWVDVALERTERRIRSQVSEIGSATEMSDIEAIVSSSTFTQLVLEAFPEFRRQRDRYFEDLTIPTFTSALNHRFGKVTAYGFGAMILIHAFSWTSRWNPLRLLPFFRRTLPFFQGANKGLAPFMHGFMKAALVMIAFTTIYETYEITHASRRRDHVEELYGTGVLGSSFYDYATLRGVNTAYAWAKWMYIGHIAMDTLLLWAPMGYTTIRGALDRSAYRVMLAQAERFSKVGLAPGAWGQLDRGIATLRAAHRRGRLSRSALGEAEAAYAELSAVPARERWDLRNIMRPADSLTRAEEALLTPRERRIRRHLIRGGVIRPEAGAAGAEDVPASAGKGGSK